jgi:amino acid adenylation domain-containing protein/FkbM family methyltransferase
VVVMKFLLVYETWERHIMKWKNEEVGSAPKGISGLRLFTGAAGRKHPHEGHDMPAAGKDFCLHHLFEKQALRTPESLAAAFEGQKLTYRELEHRANQLARHLRSLGAGPDQVVGLLTERSLAMVVGILGILKAGAAYLPIDPAFPQERVAFMLGDAGVALLVTQTGMLPGVAEGMARVCLDTFDWSGADASTQDDVHFHPRNLAYVIYTSGSTGRPKGVCVEHRNIVNYVQGVAERLQLEPGMHYASVSTVAADLGNTVIFPSLATGGCLHVISQERAENQDLLAEYFNRERIDVLKIVPSHLAALQTGKHPGQVMPRKRLILGGEASRLDWIAGLRALSPDCEIYNHYGPTETTVGVLTYHVSAVLPGTQTGTLPLGKPLPNSRIYLLDADGNPVPAGERGELCIAGSGVARGYLNRPELSAEKFVPDTFGAEPGAHMYRTGDLARSLPDGSIEFCGRLDDQVKLNGYRVELGEIECALREHGGVRDAVALAREDESGARQLVAYVIPTRSHQSLWACSQVYILPDGSPVAHLNKNETDYIYREIFGLQAYLRHGITINDGDCILDAGANIGMFSVFANRLARDLRMLSFEPNPAAFACLQANAQSYGAGVRCLPVGLSSENKSAELTFFQGLSLLSGFYADVDTEREMVKTYVMNQAAEQSENAVAEIDDLIDERLQSRVVTAQLRTLSSVIAEEGIERVDLLKINVEKSELDVLKGIAADDWRKIRQLVIEVDQEANLEPITSLLDEHGYEFVVEQDPLLRNTALCYVYAIRPSAKGGLIRQQSAEAHLRAVPAASEEILTPASLRKQLKARLPQYMVPAAFVLMEKFPLTSNGKIDRKAFPAFAGAKSATYSAVAAPQTETEKELAAIWMDLLSLEQVGVNDDFFDLGGHSLLAIRAVSRIRDKFEVNLALRNLLETPTLEALARVIDGLTWLKRSATPESQAGGREEIAL